MWGRRQALAIDAHNVKALFRRAQALVGVLDHELAQRDLAAAAKLDPANKDVRDLITKIKEDLKAQAKREKEVRSEYGNCAGMGRHSSAFRRRESARTRVPASSALRRDALQEAAL